MRATTLNQNINHKTTYAGIPMLAEVALVVLALPVLVPLMVVIALAIRLTTTGPAILTRSVEGREGRVYTEYRFRCVYMDAPKRQWAALNKPKTARRDPRVTKVGHILLITGLNKLPRLLNVLKGDTRLLNRD